ncbi:MAG: GEVED domain-containing protein, partial [Bacteroidia bacterium]
MKNIYRNLIALTILILSSFSLQAQCPYNNQLWVTIGAPTTIGASVGEQCVFPGEFIRISGMQAGSTYRISTCNTTDVADTRVTVYAQGGAGGALTFNDDFCGLLSRVDFTPTANGGYDILVDQTGPGNTCESIDECVDLSITLIGTSGSTDYCIPTYSIGTANGDFINGVSLGTINNQNSGSVGGPSYNDFTNLNTNLSSSSSYTLSVRNNPDFTEIVSAWIDYNQDFQFSDDERLGQVSISANQTGLIDFTTPANVLPGATRMRVRMVFSVPVSGGLVSSCAASSLGETEDYSVTFSTGNPPIGPGATSFSTLCGQGLQIQDNACPNYTLSTVDVGGLGSLGTTHVLSSAEIIISHEMAADLDLYLEGPDGSVVELSTDNGGAGANYGIYNIGDCSQTALFTMSAVTPIAGSIAPFVGSYLPEGDLNDFNQGTNPNGLWRLRACDDFAGDIGTIQFFKLNFSLNATEPPACAENFSVVEGAANVALDQQLSWSAGAGNPTSYDVFFGTDENNLALVSNDQSGTSYDPGPLAASTTYYYQIVPSNNAGDAVGCAVISFATVADGTPSIIMSNGQVTTCSGNFYDAGGPNDNYADNEFFLLTVFPETANSAIQVDFSSFIIEDGGFDLFAIVDGEDDLAEVIYFSLGNPDAPTTYTATNPAGALTFLFQSDGQGNFAGWEASITCVPFGSVPE